MAHFFVCSACFLINSILPVIASCLISQGPLPKDSLSPLEHDSKKILRNHVYSNFERLKTISVWISSFGGL
jgi:hypothetical protein